jgi:ATP-dependent protease ClpP protease subunit
MSRFTILGVCCAALLIAESELAPSPTVGMATQKLAVREEADRVVLAWSGPIAKPMRDDIAAALDKFKADPRRLVLTLNSPGGSLGQGHEVMTAIREAARKRPIDTRVENGAACASMCVPIYLLGAERTADPGAHFMFHEASLDPSAAPEGGPNALAIATLSRKAIETFATDLLYENDIGGQRVNARWLQEMRTKIVGREIWVSARQLVDESSGVVDALVPTVVK